MSVLLPMPSFDSEAQYMTVMKCFQLKYWLCCSNGDLLDLN